MYKLQMCHSITNTAVLTQGLHVVVTTRGAMGRGIDPSWWTNRAIFRLRQCSTTVILKKSLESDILSIHMKNIPSCNRKSNACSCCNVFPFSFLCDSLTFV